MHLALCFSVSCEVAVFSLFLWGPLAEWHQVGSCSDQQLFSVHAGLFAFPKIYRGLGDKTAQDSSGGEVLAAQA